MAEHAYEEEFEYLERLRESGETNMWGAGAYLEAEFSMRHRDAERVLLLWMKRKKEEG